MFLYRRVSPPACFSTDVFLHRRTCTTLFISPECYTQTAAEDYRGHVQVTVSGRQCQAWTSQSPHTHTRTSEKYPSSGLGSHNYCRNPDGEPTAWCYTTDPSKRWEVCDVGEPQPSCNHGEWAAIGIPWGFIHWLKAITT